MTAPHRKAPAGTEASHSNITSDDSRIPPAGFTALRHLLDAARTLHSLPAIPSDALQGAQILMTRIRSDLDRLDGAK
jgi:hypothetical protein